MIWFFLALSLIAAVPPTNHTNLEICPLITKWGYVCEEYEVLTPDGWYLKMQRIPPTKSPSKGVVFFQHGLLDSAAGVLLNGDPESLPFIIHNNSYDIWLGNNRGNKVSMTNVYYNDSQPEFWDFSFDEMGLIDLPSQLNFVLTFTNSTKLSYIGHSEGTTQALFGFTDAELASKVDVCILMAPIAYMNNTNSTMLQALAKYDVDVIFEKLGVMKFEFSDGFQLYLEEECAANVDLCYEGLELLFGPSTHINETALPADTAYFPAATSVKNMAHWFQWVRSGKYDMYDYGPQGNMQHYNQPEAPLYYLSDLPKTLNLALLTGGNDYLADPIDVSRLIKELTADGRPKPFVFDVFDYAHCDFVLAYDANKYLYPTVGACVCSLCKTCFTCSMMEKT